VLERFSETSNLDTGDVASANAATVIRSDAAMDRIRTLARTASPFVQRVLSLDRSQRVAIFEAPAGRAMSEVTDVFSPAERMRMLKRLARGIAAIADLGQPHGAITADQVLLDDHGTPTILIAGTGDAMGASAGEPGAAGNGGTDVAAILAVVAAMPGGAIIGWDSLSAATDAEDLYRLADVLETRLLAG
jgi:hypothetical protein